jgi:16S rRNA U516 pseudouridylate synthase RsuA-like enzyme
MTTITIALPEDRARKLRELADEVGVAPEELLRVRVEEWLEHPRPDKDFAAAATYVLRKNAGLYQRLAVPAAPSAAE